MLVNLLITMLLFGGSIITSVLYVDAWVKQNMPYQQAWINLLLDRFLGGRPVSDQLFKSSLLLFACAYAMMYGLNTNPMAADVIFPVYDLAVMFTFVTLITSLACLIATPFFWLREQFTSTKS
jgi:uncharacterized protein involved in cysteine biosynthesis